MQSNATTQGETPEDISRDVAAVSRLSAVPTLLRVLCDTTGMGFAAVARVTDKTWIACAVVDDIQFGLEAGGELELNPTLCAQVRTSGRAIFVDHASVDPQYKAHHTLKFYNIESYVSVPIVLESGRYFGNLCAIDPAPAKVSEPRVASMFMHFADLIALQLDAELSREQDRAALHDARSANELREQFVAILGHDLRNPLQAVHATGELLEKRITDPKLAAMAGRIKTNVRRMSALIDDVLDLARGRLGGGIGVQLNDIQDISGALGAVVKELQVAQPDRRILASINVAKPVRCDVGRVQQVLSNLIANALIHGSAEGPVEVSAVTTADELVLCVWNDGEPIPPASIERIFEPYWRVSSSGSRQGLGLGLYICFQVVRAHAGRLTVTSTRQEGTRFTVHLPLRAAVQQARLGT